MSRDRIFQGAIVALAVAVLAIQLPSCGGGGSSSTAAPAGVTRGVVTGFGSIFVNGVEYITDTNTIRRDLDSGTSDIPGLDNEVFRVGMVVEVRHGAGDNNATQIDYRDNLEGPVSGLAGGNFTVLGIPVVTDNTTVIQLDGGAALADGAIAEVSGLPDNAGVLHATFVEIKPAGSVTVFELKGYVAANNLGTDNTFTLGIVPNSAGSVTVRVDTATVFDMTGGRSGLSVGSFVEVKTTSVAAPLLATAVEAEGPETESPEGAKVSIEGYPSNINATAKTFTLMGLSVMAGGAVTYESPMTGFADITTVTKIEVHGAMSGGTLTAEQIGPR